MALRYSPHEAHWHQQRVQMRKLFVRLVKDESGVTAIEYGLIAGLISVLIIASVTLIGTQLQAVFEAIAAALAGA